MKLWSGLRAALLMSVLTLAACATAADPAADGAAGADAAGNSSIIVQNNETRELLIYLEPQGRGEREALGTVQPAATQTFTRAITPGYYRLTAAHNTGQTQSNQFNVPRASEIRWNISANQVTVSRK